MKITFELTYPPGEKKLNGVLSEIDIKFVPIVKFITLCILKEFEFREPEEILHILRDLQDACNSPNSSTLAFRDIANAFFPKQYKTEIFNIPGTQELKCRYLLPK